MLRNKVAAFERRKSAPVMLLLSSPPHVSFIILVLSVFSAFFLFAMLFDPSHLTVYKCMVTERSIGALALHVLNLFRVVTPCTFLDCKACTSSTVWFFFHTRTRLF